MGKTILTPKQSDFLELVGSEEQITSRFYFTGETALAEFYLKHRLSEDIDLFTEKEEVNQINKGTEFKNLSVDSVYDIAVNKIQTMFTRTRSRDTEIFK